MPFHPLRKQTGYHERPNMIDVLESVAWSQSLLEEPKYPSKMLPQGFHIHGWRWHQAALLRDARRFRNQIRAARCSSDLTSRAPLVASCEWLSEGNWGDFRRVENELFFP